MRDSSTRLLETDESSFKYNSNSDKVTRQKVKFEPTFFKDIKVNKEYSSANISQQVASPLFNVSFNVLLCSTTSFGQQKTLVLVPVWPDLAKFRHFVKSLQVFGNFLTVYFLFGKMLSLLWQICDIIGLIFNVANVQILKNNLTIWSHLC